MQFELTSALMGDILFSMENQDIEFRLDTHSGTVIGPDDDAEDDERFVSLPNWGPSEGFRLMEHFAASLHNPAVSNELSSALNRKRGVFRAFKDVISRYPEIEKRWHVFKDREMKREIIAWYNGLRERWGLEAIGEEPDEVEDIVLEDFRFREGGAADSDAAVELHQTCLESGSDDCFAKGTFSVLQGEVVDSDDSKTGAVLPMEMNAWRFPGDFCLVAENSGGDFAAYISACFTAPSHLHIFSLEVKAEYRGLGLGEALLTRLLEKIDREKTTCASIDLPETAKHFARVLLREDFAPCVQRYYRSGKK